MRPKDAHLTVCKRSWRAFDPVQDVMMRIWSGIWLNDTRLTCYNTNDALSKAVFHPKQRHRKLHLEVSRASLTPCRGQKLFLEQFFILKLRRRKLHLEVSKTSLTRCRGQKRFLEQFFILIQRSRKWHLEVSRTSLTHCKEQKQFLEHFFITK